MMTAGVWLLALALWAQIFFHYKAWRLSDRRYADEVARREADRADANVLQELTALQREAIAIQRQRSAESKAHEEICEQRFLARLKAEQSKQGTVQ